jgi:hypothetical protein
MFTWSFRADEETSSYAPSAKLTSPATLNPGCTRAAQGTHAGRATHHYENFNVVLAAAEAFHQHFYNVYAYCRWPTIRRRSPQRDARLELLRTGSMS